jgi:capsular exopolysaccharide synthesis family protein
MDEMMKQQGEAVEVDLRKLFRALWKKAWLLVLVSITCAALTLVFTVAFVAPKYESSATFFVNNGSLTGGDKGGLSSSDIAASRGLVSTYIEILNTRETLQKVIDYAKLDMTPAELKGMITAEPVEETELFQVSCTHTDPVVAENIAKAITKVFPSRITSIITNTTVQVVDSPVMPSAPVSPNKVTNTILGFLVGFLLSAGVVVLQEVLDVTIRSEEDIARSCQYSVLTVVPDMESSSRAYYQEATGKRPAVGQTVSFGNNIGFAASEAYKLLRTKLQYSFADEKNCYVIGVSSAESGEGKSLTSINLAYSLAQLGKKVMLIDCDMRRPSISAKLSISRFPGLSGYLVKQSKLEEVVHNYTMPGDEVCFQVITAGQTPPIPVELLSSVRMTGLLDKLREHYDYVLLDLPPVGEVSDALVVAKDVDGILLVVRQNFCDRRRLESAVRQFEFVNGRILGVVYNGIQVSGKYYKNKKYYGYVNRGDRNYDGRYVAKPGQNKETK